MTAGRWVAVGLTPIALVLMRQTEGQRIRELTIGNDLVLLLSFLMGGAVFITHKVATKFGGDRGHLPYQISIFNCANIGSGLVAMIGKNTIFRFDCVVGVAAGICNCLATLFVILAVGPLGVVVVYPVQGAGAVGLNLLGGSLLWRKSIGRRQALGCLIAVAIVCLSVLLQA